MKIIYIYLVGSPTRPATKASLNHAVIAKTRHDDLRSCHFNELIRLLGIFSAIPLKAELKIAQERDFFSWEDRNPVTYAKNCQTFISMPN